MSSKFASSLLIDDLRQMAAVPNSLDRVVLRQIENGIAGDVFKTRAPVLTAFGPEAKRSQLAHEMNQGYRARAGGAHGFSVPLYLEEAANFYRLEIKRILQRVRDSVAHGMAVAQVYSANSINEMTALDPGMAEMADGVARSFNELSGAFERLARVETAAAKNPAAQLQEELRQGLAGVTDSPFGKSMLKEVHARAIVQREAEGDAQVMAPRRP